MLLYQKISKDIRHSVDSGDLGPGAKIPSVNDLRQDYGVSHITALRVYKELTDANYIQKLPGKGYFVRERFLKKTVITGTIGCFVRPLREYRIEDNYFNDINYGIQSECCARRINLFRSHALGGLYQKTPTDEGLSEIKRAMLNIADQVDGFLVDERIPDPIISEVIEETNKPALIVNRRSELEIDAVGPADRQGMLDALEKISRMGYNQFVFCSTEPSDSRLLAPRYEAFKEFTKINKIDKANVNIINNCNIRPWSESALAIEKIIRKKAINDKILIVSAADSFARGLTSILLTSEFKLKEDFGICGFNGLGYANNFKPQLSTVDVNPVKIGTMAVDILMSRISREQYLKPTYHSPDAIFIFGETV